MIVPLPLPDVSHWRCLFPALPMRQTRGRAIGFCGAAAVAVTVGNGWRETPCWWPAGAPVPIDSGARKRVVAVRAGGDDIAGYWLRSDGSAGGALDWRLQDGALQARELHPASGWEWTWALGAGGGCLVGSGRQKAARGSRTRDRPLCWLADGRMVELPLLEPESEALACATDGVHVVGHAKCREGQCAVLWAVDGRSVVMLGSLDGLSEVCGVADGEQVGYFWAEGAARAALWRGTAASRIDLTPVGFADARAFGCGGGYQVGFVIRRRQTRSGGASPLTRAALWAGSAPSWIDLQALLPPPWNASSAIAVGVFGDTLRVVGEAQQVVMENEGTRNERYFLAAQVPVTWETKIA